MTNQFTLLYRSALTENPAGSICRNLILSLWDERYHADCADLLQLDPERFRAASDVLQHLHSSSATIDEFIQPEAIQRLM